MIKDRLAVLHVIPSMALSTGGPAVNVASLANAMQSLGMKVSIFSTDASNPAQSVKPRGGATPADLPENARELDVSLFPIDHPYRLTYSRSLGQALNSHVQDFDVVHIHSVNLYPQFAAWRSASKHHVPYIVSPRGALDPWIRGRRRLKKQLVHRLWQKSMLDGAAAVHLTTEEERQLIEPMGITAPTAIIPNGFTIDDFAETGDGQSFRDQWLDGYGGPLVLNHGRLSEKKGLNILVQAIALLQSHARLALVGSDDEGIGNQLRAQAMKLGISELVTIVPRLTGKELKDAISAADVWVLPSYTENFGMAVAEAMAAGRPVITSPHVNIAQDASNEHALTIVENDPSELATSIDNLLSNSIQSREMGNRGRIYSRRYDWSSVSEKFLHLYEGVRAGGTQSAVFEPTKWRTSE